MATVLGQYLLFCLLLAYMSVFILKHLSAWRHVLHNGFGLFRHNNQGGVSCVVYHFSYQSHISPEARKYVDRQLLEKERGMLKYKEKYIS